MLDAVEERSLLRHALTGLVLHLYHQGHHALLQPPRLRLADRVCELISVDPAREWRSASGEAELAISSASLRRQLAMENTSLRDILAEARLSQALFLLQTIRLPVKTVALRSGYRSVSSFVRRFHFRYGVDPSRVSNA